ncbi:MAG: transglycosylase SLT domain-containing protein [Aeromonas sp.]
MWLVAAELPAERQEAVVCAVAAAMTYGLPANLMLAVAEKESGRAGQWVRNKNGTHDVGAMQFNTQYLKDLARYGIRAEDVAAKGCYAFNLAAWRLRQHLRYDEGDMWRKAANYHSRTPRFNAIYRADLMQKATRWAAWLELHLATVNQPNISRTASTAAGGVAARTNPTSTYMPANTVHYVPRTITVRSD